jgi:DNA-binding SARP family transcriptional activator
MTAYAQTGRYRDALRQYAECVNVLEMELGLPPSKRTSALYDQIRAQLSERARPASSLPRLELGLPASVDCSVGWLTARNR